MNNLFSSGLAYLPKRGYRVLLIAALCSIVVVFGIFSQVQTTHAAPAGTIHGCPAGYVCIYPQNAGWNHDRPSLKYFHYGVYQLHNQFGMHEVFNNQTGGAWLDLCTDGQGKNHTSPGWSFGPGSLGQVDLTPINSIKLKPTSV